ncbi:nitrite/sulfite reductase [Haloquadratum walsbyi]|jgi:assimilatory nitrite reductase (ferredoxin) precursor (EC 1.7.7.1)|uniref:Sulfite reductase, beta subunit (Hemoprotein) n=1 Tax=Haloquadratum walsbyi J07HQW2 TaxID=1238425 RepID=U1MVJ8_9EURY|nr:sulfite reductase subunit beta [Haloquadratum walsbyi]ERG94414.1 MAG: sulfite reductase, beta subunit (hemoprotein) [Haloquadratum walsbyi J07HQW2]
MANKKEQWKDELYGDEVRQKILEFADQGWESIPEDERDAWFSRFKFWGVFHQRSGQESYFMMRLANTNGVLTASQLRAIGEVAAEYAVGPVENPEFGDSWIDFTTRQSVQLHWIKLEDVPAIWDRLEAVGLSSRSSGGDTMRNIAGCPVAGRDKHEFVDAQPVLDEIAETIRADDDLANMPRKFNISVTGCREGCAQDSINGIGLEPAEKLIDDKPTRGFNVRVGGGLGGREPRRARSLDVFVKPENACAVVRGFVELYFEHGDRSNRQKNRSRFFIDEWGTEEVRDLLESSYVDFPLHHEGANLRDEYTYNAGKTPAEGKHDHIGVHEQSDGRHYVGLSVPIGRLTATETVELADLADTYGSGAIRLTRRQNPLIMDIPESALDDILAADLLETHSPTPNVFTRGSMACTGSEFCSLALTETKARMATLLRWLRTNVDVPADVEQLKIHYSGCTADCGQATTADIGLQGMRARKNGEMVEAIDVGVGGGVGPDPSFVEWIRQRVPADEIPGLLGNLLTAFSEQRDEGQTFREWVAATEQSSLTEFAEPEEVDDYTDPCLNDAKQSWYPFADGESPAPTTANGTPITSQSDD